MILATKSLTFDSAHYLENYRGKCANLHGHTFKLEITVACEKDYLINGMVIDFSDIKELVKKEIVDVLDHKVINDVVSFNPTAENLAHFIYFKLAGEVKLLNPNCHLYAVKLWETADSSVLVYYTDFD